MKKFLKFLFFGILIAFIAIGGIFTYQGYNMYKKAIDEISIEEKIKQIKDSVSDYVEYNQIPQDYINAVVAVEDRRFFKHNGIDLISIGRAVLKDIMERKLVEGGSTITQQLAKNTYFTQRKEFTRKIAEIFTAFEYERVCTKEEIFELYVNTIYYGDGYYCISDATRGYFDKNIEELDLYEITLLAGIPNAPSVYAPTKNPELAKQRQNQVLKKMVKYNYLTQEEADKLISSNNF